MKFIRLLLICLFLLAYIVPVYAAANPWGQSDTYQLLGRELPYDLVYKGTTRGGVSTIVSTVSKLTSTHLAFSILLLNGASKTFTLDEGVVGQEITLVKNQYDAGTLRLSFDTTYTSDETAHTGFTYVTWPTRAGDFVTLAWIDSTTGWILTAASSGITVTY